MAPPAQLFMSNQCERMLIVEVLLLKMPKKLAKNYVKTFQVSQSNGGEILSKRSERMLKYWLSLVS